MMKKKYIAPVCEFIKVNYETLVANSTVYEKKSSEQTNEVLSNKYSSGGFSSESWSGE